MQSLEFLRTWRERTRKWQERVPAPSPLPSDVAMEGAFLTGEPLITLVEPVIDPDLFADVLSDLTSLYAQTRPEVGPVVGALARSSPAERRALAEALLAGHGPGEWADRHGLSTAAETLLTLAGLALQPFMARFAAAVTAHAPLAMWRQNFCPVCGTQPDVCRIDPDNLRFLHCPQCDTQWEHHRLTCANCDSDDVKKVHLLTLESLEPWRVELCEVCGGYIKTLDQRHGGLLAMPKVDLYLEDARTLQLDLLAEQEGYRRGGRAQ
ncbi:MAG: formate dehydrogenase accessory protein FdhE [Bacillota bacterium]